MFGLGHWEIILILVIVLIVFGAGKLPKVAGELAKGIKSFKEGLKEDKKNDNEKKIMFNIGIIELLIVVFFCGSFVKPEEIPKITKNIGLLYRKITRYYYNFKFELDEINEIDYLEEVKPDLKKKKSKIPKKNNLFR